MSTNFNAEYFYRLSFLYINHSAKKSVTIGLRRFKNFFGVSPKVCAITWSLIKHNAQAFDSKHLLWCLLFLKQYGTEYNRHTILKADEKTIRKWTWTYVQLLSEMDIIRFEHRFKQALEDQSCFCSLDGINFKIGEPFPFNRKWYSHKFKGPGLRYEIALNIRTGDIVWKFGGYPCGEFPDLKLALQAYVLAVNPGEKTIADLGYANRDYFILPDENNGNRHKQIMSRHETVNKRIRQFKILQDTFRNDLHLHPLVFHAVLNLTQLQIENGEPLYSVS